LTAQYFNRQQRNLAAQIAKGQGSTCRDCGSSDLVPEDRARSQLGGTAKIVLWCNNEEHMSPISLQLSKDEATLLGLNWTREFPETGG
jgi:hypothetical protein